MKKLEPKNIFVSYDGTIFEVDYTTKSKVATFIYGTNTKIIFNKSDGITIYNGYRSNYKYNRQISRQEYPEYFL